MSPWNSGTTWEPLTLANAYPNTSTAPVGQGDTPVSYFSPVDH